MASTDTTLKLSDNSKVKFRANHFNTFGLWHGRPEAGGTCPGATEGPGGCLGLKKVGGVNATCYVDKLVKAYPNFGKVLRYNTELLRGKTQAEMEGILSATLAEFIARNKNGPLVFRLHTSGDFFSQEYALAWAQVIRSHPHVRFWAYTRSLWAVPLLVGCPNLALYISADPVNYDKASKVYDELCRNHKNLGIAFMGNAAVRDPNRKWVTCPELSGRVKSTSSMGACARCKLCMTFDDRIALRSIQFPVH